MGFFISFEDDKSNATASGYIFEFFAGSVFDINYVRQELTRLGGNEQVIDMLELMEKHPEHPFVKIFNTDFDRIRLSY